MIRIVVIGCSCSGKSTFSQRLAEKLDIEYIELDELHWLPNWQERSNDEFHDLVDIATKRDSWVVDGNYSVVRDMVWSRATQVLWLNRSFRVVLYRAFARSIMRAVTKKKLFAGNVESFRHSFLSRESIILWVIKTYHQKRRNLPKLLKSIENKGIKIIEFNHQSEIDEYLKR